MDIRYPLVDSDSHYYETYDCFTRHLETKFRDRAIRPVKHEDGIARVYQGEHRLWFEPNWPLDMAGAPGSLTDYFLGEVERHEMIGEAIVPADFPAMYNRAARVGLLDQQGVEATIMLPSLSIGLENEIRHDVDALYANVRSLNRWIAEEWGWGADGRIYATAVLSLVDADAGVAELQRVLDEGARTVYLAPGPMYGRSPAAPDFDAFWGTLNDAEVPVIFHIGDGMGRYAELVSTLWGERSKPPLHKFSAFQTYVSSGDRIIMDTIAALILHNLFGRFPKLKVMSIELGCAWVPWLLKYLEKANRDTFGRPSLYGSLTGTPTELFKEHVYITPFYEDDAVALAEAVGVDHVLFGSDYPHPEGVREPVQFADRLVGMSAAEVRKVMRENTANLLQLR